MSIKENFNKKLLVEGADDQHVIWALCNKFKINQIFDVIDCEGIENLHKAIAVRFKQSEIKSIGIIIDADTDIKLRWEAIRKTLVQQKFIIPENLPSDGLMLENEFNVRIGVWIMPNNFLNGMLEDFITLLVPKDDKLLPVISENLKDIENKRLQKYLPIHKSKALVHSWLALQEEPGTPLGFAITKKYLTTDEETCLKFVSWLENLFNK